MVQPVNGNKKKAQKENAYEEKAEQTRPTAADTLIFKEMTFLGENGDLVVIPITYKRYVNIRAIIDGVEDNSRLLPELLNAMWETLDAPHYGKRGPRMNRILYRINDFKASKEEIIGSANQYTDDVFCTAEGFRTYVKKRQEIEHRNLLNAMEYGVGYVYGWT